MLVLQFFANKCRDIVSLMVVIHTSGGLSCLAGGWVELAISGWLVGWSVLFDWLPVLSLSLSLSLSAPVCVLIVGVGVFVHSVCVRACVLTLCVALCACMCVRACV